VTTLTALSTLLGGTSLYVLGLDGKVWTNFFPAADGTARWNGWFPLGDNLFPERATVSALSTTAGGTSLYVQGLDRKIWTNVFPSPDHPGEWEGWWPVLPSYLSWLPVLPGLRSAPFSRENPFRASQILE
jgi:hypothetical protein